MKKLAIFGLAMMLVLGMSVVSMAAQISDSQDITVDVTVSDYAEVVLNSTTATLNFETPGEKVTDTIPFTLKTNTAGVKIMLQENISRAMATRLGDSSLVWGLNDLSDFTSHLVSPDAWVEGSAGSRTQWTNDSGVIQGIQYTSNPFNSVGIHEGNIVIGSEYKADKDWTQLSADEADMQGTVTVTVIK